MKTNKKKPAAILTMRNVSILSKRDREMIASWLRHHADDLVMEGQAYSKNFRGRMFL